mmetsp:Transcript_133348/g.371752  ORF Transcript_133348/g.371752 Transcript_133348/m.371752 type:complete len:331 (-) Transcript_133348:94-1086(-)
MQYDDQFHGRILTTGFPPPPRPSPVPFEEIGLIGFYYPDRELAWDILCGSSFLGNFYPLGPGALRLPLGHSSAVTRSFSNAEAAFQALKFRDHAHEFEELSGSQAFRKKRQLSGKEDWTYSGFGSNWLAMLAVLRVKFRQGTPMANALVQTRGAFLLEHNEAAGRDKIWSDNQDGTGWNWLGFQLMLVRDELQGSGSRHGLPGAILGWIDRDTGRPVDEQCGREWQGMVRRATMSLMKTLRSQSGAGWQFRLSYPGDALPPKPMQRRREPCTSAYQDFGAIVPRVRRRSATPPRWRHGQRYDRRCQDGNWGDSDDDASRLAGCERWCNVM